MNCSLPGSSVHGIPQARILEWVAISFSRGSSQPRDKTWISCIASRLFTTEPPRKPLWLGYWRTNAKDNLGEKNAYLSTLFLPLFLSLYSTSSLSYCFPSFLNLNHSNILIPTPTCTVKSIIPSLYNQ